MGDNKSRPPCFGNPKLGTPCNACGVRGECFEKGAVTRKVFLLPRSRPPVRETKAGAALAIEADCATCGPTQKMRIKGQVVCARCRQPLEE